MSRLLLFVRPLTTNDFVRLFCIINPKFRDIEDKSEKAFCEELELDKLEKQIKANKKANKTHLLEVFDDFYKTMEFIKQERKRIHYTRIARTRLIEKMYRKYIFSYSNSNRVKQQFKLLYSINAYCKYENFNVSNSKLKQLVNRNSLI